MNQNKIFINKLTEIINKNTDFSLGEIGDTIEKFEIYIYQLFTTFRKIFVYHKNSNKQNYLSGGYYF